VNCGSEEEIQKWAHEDLTSIIDWLQQQDAKVLHSNRAFIKLIKSYNRHDLTRMHFTYDATTHLLTLIDLLKSF
jgi:hypothetical protein